MERKPIKVSGGGVNGIRFKNDVINNSITQLAPDHPDINSPIRELLQGLRRKYPKDDAIIKLSEVFGVEPEPERTWKDLSQAFHLAFVNDKVVNTILAVDTDVAVHERETAEWRQYGFDALRVDTMTEAISLLARRDDFISVAINEDTIPEFMLQLHIMRDVTDLPIFVITSNYTIDKSLKAMSYGVDVYDDFNAYSKNNVLGALSLLKTQNKWVKRPTKTLKVLTGGGIILSPLRRSVFIKDIPVFLAKKEFDILQYLMANSERVVTHARLMRKVWGDRYKSKDMTVLWRTVDRLRRKLFEVSPENEYLEIERGVGYRFSASATR